MNQAFDNLSQKVQKLEDKKHIFTHIEWNMQGYCVHVDDFIPTAAFIWADSAELDLTYTMPTAFIGYKPFKH